MSAKYLSSKINTDIDRVYDVLKKYAQRHLKQVEWGGYGNTIFVKEGKGKPVFRVWLNTRDGSKVESIDFDMSLKDGFDDSIREFFKRHFPNITWEEIAVDFDVNAVEPGDIVNHIKKGQLSANQKLQYVDIGLSDVENITNNQREELRKILESLDRANKFLLARAWCQLATSYHFSVPEGGVSNKNTLKDFISNTRKQVKQCLDKAKNLVGEYEPTVAATTMILMRKEMDQKSYLALGKKLVDKNIYNKKVVEIYLKALKETGEEVLFEKTLNEILSKNKREGYFDRLVWFSNISKTPLSGMKGMFAVLVFFSVLLLFLFGTIIFFEQFRTLFASFYDIMTGSDLSSQKSFSIFGILFSYLFTYSFGIWLHRLLVKKSKWYLINIYPLTSRIQLPKDDVTRRAGARISWRFFMRPFFVRIHHNPIHAMLISLTILVALILIGAD